MTLELFEGEGMLKSFLSLHNQHLNTFNPRSSDGGELKVVVAYIKQQPYNLRLAVEGGLVQRRPRFGCPVDVDPCFEQQPRKSKQV